ncbi:MAG: YdcF family protein [Planctomycetota bacterium]
MNVQAELLLRILCDTLPAEGADAAYLFAQTESNQESVFAVARELLERDAVGKVLISDCDPKCGYVGAVAYRKAMIEFGVPETRIEEVPMEPTEILHTLVESRAVVQFAKAKGYDKLIVVSAPFHQERAFMTTVTAAVHDGPELKLYSHPGRTQPWDEVVTHSQGILEGTRAELIAAEQERIDKYMAQGDLAPREKVLQYLRARD